MKNPLTFTFGFITASLMTVGEQAAYAFVLGDLATPISSETQTINGFVGSNEFDLYQIFLSEGVSFTATTEATNVLDTQLFLFNSSGQGVLANDDIIFDFPDINLNSRIPAWEVPESGNYFLAVSGYDYDPYSGSDLIFPTFPYDGVYSPLTLEAVTGFSSFGYDSGWGSDSGEYSLQLLVEDDSVSVPEPISVFTLVLLGAGFLMFKSRKVKF